MVKGFRCLALYRVADPDHYVRVPLHWGDIKTLEFLGVTYKKTNRRTEGGWPVFQEIGGPV